MNQDAALTAQERNYAPASPTQKRDETVMKNETVTTAGHPLTISVFLLMLVAVTSLAQVPAGGDGRPPWLPLQATATTTSSI